MTQKGSDRGGRSRHIHRVEDARALARRRMPRMMYDFVDGATGNEIGAALNCEEIDRIRLLPRVFVDVENRNLSKNFLGRDRGLPFGIAPMGMCNLAWPDADRMLAAEAVRREVPICLSTAASTSIEDMQDLADGRAWFQLYVGESHDAALGLADRAAAAGYEALLLTVDVPQISRRVRDLRNGLQLPFKYGHRQLLDFARHPRWSLETLLQGLPRTMNFEAAGNSRGFARDDIRGGTDWTFLERLREHWRGKLIVKGVLSPSDAVRIRDVGADAVYVSNHGGRQLDGAPAAIHALPLVREAVGPDYPLLFDSGLRNGEGIVKALALGADFVMLGRAFLYAVGADGARGLSTVFDVLADEIDVTLAQIGRRRVEDVDRAVLADPPTATADRDALREAAVVSMKA